jgi:hypothetical protein
MSKKVCEHGKNKYDCRECGGSTFCEHNKRKIYCRECKGSHICEHNKIKTICKECGGSQICIHNKRKSRCKECCGSSICKHQKIKYTCKKCSDSSQFCEHNKRKTYCKECKGTQICEHEKIRSYCKECSGSQYCIHQKQKKRCKECEGSSLCKSSWCETYANTKYEGFCLPCFVNNPENNDKPVFRNYKTKEKDVVDRIKQSFPDFTWVSDKKVFDGCSRRRPDLLLDMGSHIIIVEIDENKHTDYDCSCENKRLMELSQDLQHRPIIFIRFNPDSYINSEGISIKSCWKLNKLGVITISKSKQTEWEERINNLKEQIKYWVDNPTEKTIEIIELFY